MSIKMYFIFFSFFIFVSCAQHPTKNQKPQTENSIPVPATPAGDSEQSTSSTPPPSTPEDLVSRDIPINSETQISDSKKKIFAVWIDSLGLDSFAALGFLQELSKKGIKPVKIVGSGMGCWIAQSWALAGSANRAEWQAMKWNDWKSLSPSLIGRWTGSPSESFENGIHKLISVKSWDAFKVKVDCAVLPKSPPFHFTSAYELKPEFAFWISMQQESLGISESQVGLFSFYSGALGGAPSADELESFTGDLNLSPDETFAGWMILSSRGIFVEDENAKFPVRLLLSGRDLQWPSEHKFGQMKVPVTVVNLAGPAKRNTAMISSPENRRRFLLEGRKIAPTILQSNAFIEFLK